MRSTPTQVPRIYFVHIPTPDRLRLHPHIFRQLLQGHVPHIHHMVQQILPQLLLRGGQFPAVILQLMDKIVFYSFHFNSFGANLIAIANNTDSPAVTDYGLNFLCQAQNPYFFNSMSVPIHFAEILAYCIGAIMGKKSSDIMNTMDAVGNYFRHNKL